MNSSRTLKSAAVALLPLLFSTVASATQDPCAANTTNEKCVQAITALHERTTTHSAAAAHAKAATNATRPLVEETPPETAVPEMDRIHSGEAHPVAARHEKQAH